jgi:hypothetical protein
MCRFMVSSKTKVLTVRMPNEMATCIRLLAERNGVTTSEMMVQILDKGLGTSYANPKQEERK